MDKAMLAEIEAAHRTAWAVIWFYKGRCKMSAIKAIARRYLILIQWWAGEVAE